MKVVFGYLYRPTDFYSKVLPLVRNYNDRILPSAKVFLSDSGHESFNREASHNLIAKHAIDEKADIAIICAADTILDGKVVKKAVQLAAEQNWIVSPFTRVNVVTATELRRLRRKDISRIEIRSEYDCHYGSCYIFKPSLWLAAGGMNESFDGWGQQDKEFHLRAISAGTPVIHLPGDVWSVDHERPLNSSYRETVQFWNESLNKFYS